MPTKIELTDCMFKHEEPLYQRIDGKDIEIVLPEILFLAGLRYTKDHPEDHFRYRNQHGDLAITCGMWAYFEPNWKNYTEKESRLFWRTQSHMKSNTNSCFHGLDTFKINDPKIKEQLRGEMTSEEMLAHITQNHPWNSYLNLFINWLNEFKREHPENVIPQGTEHPYLCFANDTYAYLRWNSTRAKSS